MKLKSHSGFTLLELMAVIAIVASVAAFTFPFMMKTTGNIRLSSTASSVATLIQNTRMLAVRDNKFYSMRAATVAGANIFYVDMDENSTYRQGESRVQLAGRVVVVSPAAIPVPLTASNYILDSADPASFNSRGLPCVASGVAPTVCNTLVGGNQVGFVYYLQAQPPFGPVLYKAVSVTPAGRVRIWSLSQGVWQ
jgi:prepilin-type N-terminal cleavage/methylation domain-containing protein